MLRISILAAVAVNAAAEIGIVRALAGTGAAAYQDGDGSLATDVPVNYPYGITQDGANNVYIADTYNNRVRVVSYLSGIITTFAGNGDDNFYGEGVPATQAALSMPMAVTISPAGLVTISDTLNNRIRRVDENGIITTIVGTGVQATQGTRVDSGPATSALLWSPRGITYDAAGHLYICDSLMHRILVVTFDAVNGNTFTLLAGANVNPAGNGGPAINAGIWEPRGVVVDSILQRVYFTEAAPALNNNRVRYVSLADNTMQPFFGGAPIPNFGSLNEPSALTLVPNTANPSLGSDVIIADTENDWIVRVSIVDLSSTIVAGTGAMGNGPNDILATASPLWDPAGVFYSGGKLLIADTDNSRVRYVFLTDAPATSTNTPSNSPTGSATQSEAAGASASQTAVPSVSATTLVTHTPTSSHTRQVSSSLTGTSTPRSQTPSITPSGSSSPSSPPTPSATLTMTPRVVAAPAAAAVAAGPIAGAAVGGAAFVALVGAAALFLYRRRSPALPSVGPGGSGRIASPVSAARMATMSGTAATRDWSGSGATAPVAVHNPMASMGEDSSRRLVAAFPPVAPGGAPGATPNL